MVNFGPGGSQWLVQAVPLPLTALVCAATIALILLVGIVAQSLGSQPRRIQENLQPSSP